MRKRADNKSRSTKVKSLCVEKKCVCVYVCVCAKAYASDSDRPGFTV